MRSILLLSIGLLSASAALGQSNTYYQNLLGELANDYGITGGAWMIEGSEEGVLQSLSPSSGVSAELLEATGQPFTRALRATTTDQANPWDRALRSSIDIPVVEGGAALLVFWIRLNQAAEEGGRIDVLFEQGVDPYTKSFTLGLTSLPDEWTRVFVPFTLAQSYGVGQARLQVNLGYQAQEVELAGVAVRYYGAAYDEDDLPESVPMLENYGGRDPGAPWRAQAAARIDMHRKGDLMVEVQDTDGQPVAGAAVTAEMQEHAFGFGTAFSTNQMVATDADAERYREALYNLNGDGRSFNILVPENALKWQGWEGGWPTRQEVTAEIVADLKARGFRIRGHNLVWPTWQYLPSDLEANQNDEAYLRQRVEDHFEDILNYDGIRGNVDEWDVVNEMYHVTDLTQALGGPAILAEWYKLAAEEAPEVKLFVNEYSILSSGGSDRDAQEGYRARIQDILDGGGRVDGIGFQAHMGRTPTAIDTVYALLEDFAGFGAEFSITEYDAAGMSDALAADYIRDFMTITFSHPQMASFLMWDFWDPEHWLDDAPLYNADWTLKPSGEVFLELVFDTWWTSEALSTDGAGRAAVRGFRGDYEVAVTADGFENVYVDTSLTEATTLDVTLGAVGAVAPPAPTGLGVTMMEGSPVLAWADRSKGETGFVIERRAEDGVFAPVDTVGADATTFTEGALAFGQYAYRVYATNAAGDSGPTAEVAVSVTDVTGRTTYGNGGTPGSGEPWAISREGTTRIEAENYNVGGEGIAYHDADPANNGLEYRSDGVDIEPALDEGDGFNVGWVEAGEWLQYTIGVAEAGVYDLRLRVAREPEGESALRVKVGPDAASLEDWTGTVIVPSTGAWQTWTTIQVAGLQLEAGEQILRLEMEGELFNVNWFELSPSSGLDAEGAEQVPEVALDPIFPNPVHDGATVRFQVRQGQTVRLALYDVTGRRRAVLFDGLVPGRALQEVRLAAHALPSGVYLLRLEGDTVRASQAVTVVR